MKNESQLPKMSLICSRDELRPQLNYVLITKDHVIATDCHALVKHPTEELFSDEFIEAMPDRILVHKINWKLMEKSHNFIFYTNNQIQVIYNGYSICIPCKTEDEIEKKYPNYEELFNEKTESVEGIGINPVLVDSVKKAMFRPYETTIMKFVFNGISRAIKVSNTSNGCEAILMPCMITD